MKGISGNLFNLFGTLIIFVPFLLSLSSLLGITTNFFGLLKPQPTSLIVEVPIFLISFAVISILLKPNIFLWLLMMILSLGFRNRISKFEKEDKPTVSVIIPAHNEEKVVANLLSDFLRQKYRPLEVIVVVHNCLDKTKEVVEEFVRSRNATNLVKLVELNTKTTGKALALNAALQQARGEIIGHFDTDNRILDENYIGKVVRYFSDDNVNGIQTNVQVLNPQQWLPKMINVETNIFSVRFQKGRAVLGLPALSMGTGTFYRASILKSPLVSGWRNFLVEDFELSMRLSKLEIRNIFFAPEIIVLDEKPVEWQQLINQRVRWFKGNLQVCSHYLKWFDNPVDFIYRLSPVFAYIRLFLLFLFYFLFYFFAMQGILLVGNIFQLLLKISLAIWLIPLVLDCLLSKIGIIDTVSYLFFAHHWMWVSFISLLSPSKEWKKTSHTGGTG